MKITTLILAVLAMLTFGCKSPDPNRSAGETQVSISGTSGATVTGYYVQHGEQKAILNTVPWTFSESGISAFEIKKAKPSDILHVRMRYKSQGVSVKREKTLDTGTHSMHVNVSNGFETKSFSR